MTAGAVHSATINKAAKTANAHAREYFGGAIRIADERRMVSSLVRR